MKPIDVKSDSFAEYNEGLKFRVGDHVRISKYKNIFAKEKYNYYYLYFTKKII